MDLLSGLNDPPLPVETLERLAKRQVFLGTSSWKYPGWRGWFYQAYYKNDRAFERESLAEYARVLPAVGVDHTYYNWPNSKLFNTYSEQTPETFRFGLKVTDQITAYRFPKIPRYGQKAGQDNPDFLNAQRFRDFFLRPLDSTAQKIGPVILEFTRFSPGTIASGREFVERLDAFFAQLKTESAFQFAVELRNSNWLKQPYFECLKRHNVAHVFNSWTAMPCVQEQWQLASPYALPFIAARILLRPGTQYAQAVESFSPYDKTIDEQPELREAIAQLIVEAIRSSRPAYIFVNNRAEGCAPKTIAGVLALLDQRYPDLLS